MTDAPYKVVLDTCVVVAGFRSKRGASFAILSLLPDERFQLQLSTALAIEYESALTRSVERLDFGPTEASQAVSALCLIAAKHEIFYLWRPFLPDPGDEFVLELCVKSGADYLVTHNIGDFAGAESFGIRVVTPGRFLGILREDS